MFGDKHNRTLLKGNKTINMNFKYTILTDRSKYNLINHLLIIARLHMCLFGMPQFTYTKYTNQQIPALDSSWPSSSIHY